MCRRRRGVLGGLWQGRAIEGAVEAGRKQIVVTKTVCAAASATKHLQAKFAKHKESFRWNS
ncbi:MAG TPA: hypothetical protein DCG58_07935 [Hyphomonas adhaerens]|uniref:Uncharacterized protein n=1 Tax=Hyphomonas adhaerens TaxID=81029 RepID=A0A3B9GYK9_9PROT|nr:hypothetical protein [Hyphomonas sp.]HAE27074.1 hypothetical protein [Hyphomonas adhaerens]|tara:strand:+ start:232 stop:414 length:183 start_codon:yes stop_codon:yes gene_type:complete